MQTKREWVSNMHEVLSEKKVLFFDVGYTLDYPASGDWMFTKKFYEFVGNRLNEHSVEEIQNARIVAFHDLENNHLVTDTEEEYRQFVGYYSGISELLGLELTESEVQSIAHDHVYNMENYVTYPDVKRVLEVLCKDFTLGIISDTWPSIDRQLQHIGVDCYFSFATYSFELGVFKPDFRMFEDALKKAGCRPEEAVFIDDVPRNLEGAAKMGITPILIAANPESDMETPFVKIRALSDLLK